MPESKKPAGKKGPKPEGAAESKFDLKAKIESVKRKMPPEKSRRLAGALILYVIVCAILLSPMLAGEALREGDISPVTIRAPKTVSYFDERATREAKRHAFNNVERVYSVFPERIYEDVIVVFNTILDIHDLPAGNPDREDAIADLMDNKFLSKETVDSLLAIPKEELSASLRRKTDNVIRKIVSNNDRIDEGVIRSLQDESESLAIEDGVANQDIPVVQDIVRSLVTANSKPDDEATDKKRRAAAAAVKPVRKTETKNMPIVSKGEIISRAQLERLEKRKLIPRRIPWGRFTGGALLTLFVFVAIGAYLKNFSPRNYRNEKKMFIFYLLILFAVLWAFFVDLMSTGESWFSPMAFGIATGVLAILISIIMEPPVALIVTPFVALLITIVLQFDIGVFLVALVAGLVGCFSSVRRQDLDSIMKAGLAIALSNVIAIAILTLFDFQSWRKAAIDILGFGLLNGLSTAILAAGMLPLFERAFNIITPHRLLELSNPEQPLLKQLLINAPGTYHHCIFVGNLAEAAAEAVGGDPLLVRIACYYHDVGKLKRPNFFVENQIGGQSLLSEIAPTLGSLVINSHVRDGVEMLRENNIPEEIIRIAAEHHGTSLISFFYQQARQQAKDPDDVSEARFRYPGPKPSTLESAIMMLADGCEAAVRSLKEHTPRAIENQVNTIVKSRLVDGQFDECDITLSQIDTLRKTYIKILAGIYHARMEYPGLEEDLKRKAETDGADSARNGRASGA